MYMSANTCTHLENNVVKTFDLSSNHSLISYTSFIRLQAVCIHRFMLKAFSLRAGCFQRDSRPKTHPSPKFPTCHPCLKAFVKVSCRLFC